MREISEIGQFVCNSSTSARFHENGILRYAQTVTEMDVKFLEQVRDEAARGMDAFDMIASMDEPASSKQIKLSSYLLSILERIGAHLEGYYSSLSQESIYRPEIESNPARTRWHNLRRKIIDGSFFILAQPSDMTTSNSPQTRQNGTEVDFASIFAKAQHTLHSSPTNFQPALSTEQQTQPRRLADMHTARAAHNTQTASTFETQQANNALHRMSTFINDNMSTIRRLSRLPAEYDFTQLMATYGKHPSIPSPPSTTQTHRASPSTTSSNTALQMRAAINASPQPLPAPQALRTQPAIALRQQSPPIDPHLNRRLPPTPGSHSSNPLQATPASTAAQNPAFNAAVSYLNRRAPPRSSTPLPASPRASLALSSAGSAASRRKISADRGMAPPVPGLPSLAPLPLHLRGPSS